MLAQNQGDAKGVENGFEAFWGPLFFPIHMVPSYWQPPPPKKKSTPPFHMENHLETFHFRQLFEILSVTTLLWAKSFLQWAVLKQTRDLIRQLHQKHLKQSLTVDQPVYVGKWLLWLKRMRDRVICRKCSIIFIKNTILFHYGYCFTYIYMCCIIQVRKVLARARLL